MPKNFDQMTAFAPKNIKIAGVRIALQPLLHLQRQAVHAAPHIGMADCQPHPYPGGNRDHCRDSAVTTAAASAAGIEPGIRARACPANSISIAGSEQHAERTPAADATVAAGAISTSAKPSAAGRSSFRQR